VIWFWEIKLGDFAAYLKDSVFLFVHGFRVKKMRNWFGGIWVLLAFLSSMALGWRR